MLKCAEDQCPSVLGDKTIQNEIRVSCNEKATLDEDFTHSLIMQSVRTDVINKIRYVTHSMWHHIIFRVTIMVYSHWLGPEPGQGPGPVLCRTFHIAQGPGRMVCMVLIRTFHTAPEQGQGRTPVFITGHIFRTWKMGTRPILQVLKRFQVFFPVPVQVQCERFLLKPYNPFFQVPVPVPVPVPDQASVNTPLLLCDHKMLFIECPWKKGPHYYCPPTKLRKCNVFSRVCPSVSQVCSQRGPHVAITHDALDLIIQGPPGPTPRHFQICLTWTRHLH